MPTIYAAFPIKDERPINEDHPMATPPEKLLAASRGDLRVMVRDWPGITWSIWSNSLGTTKEVFLNILRDPNTFLRGKLLGEWHISAKGKVRILPRELHVTPQTPDED